MRLAASIAFLRSAGLKTPIEISAPFIAYRAQFGERWISSSIVSSTFSVSASLIESGASFSRTPRIPYPISRKDASGDFIQARMVSSATGLRVRVGTAYLPRVRDLERQDARLSVPSLPELHCELVVQLDLLLNPGDLGGQHAEDIVARSMAPVDRGRLRFPRILEHRQNALGIHYFTFTCSVRRVQMFVRLFVPGCE